MNELMTKLQLYIVSKVPNQVVILDWSQVKCIVAVIKHHLINPFQWRVGLVLKTH